MNMVSVVRIQRLEKGNWQTVPLNKVKHKQLGVVIGGHIRILVDGVTVYENNKEAEG